MHQVAADRDCGVGCYAGISDPPIIQTLTQKRAEIFDRIKACEAGIAHEKRNLDACKREIERFASPERPRHMVSHGFFKKGGIADICVRHLDMDDEMTTRELAGRVTVERDLEVSDAALRNFVAFTLFQALRHVKRRKLVRTMEKRKGMCVWTAGDAIILRVIASSPSTPG